MKRRLLFREVNERIREVNAAYGLSAEFYEVFCECGRQCLLRLDVPAAVYADVRRDAQRFLVQPGHEEPGQDRVVARARGYRVVSSGVPAFAGADLRRAS